MRLPSPIRVGCIDIVVRYGIPLDGALGHYFQHTSEIVITEGLSDALTRKTVFHEVQHAVWCESAIDNAIEEEDGVSRTTSLMYDTFTRKENKKLRTFLFGEE